MKHINIICLKQIYPHDRPQKAIWHGAHASGERSMDAFCDEWQTDDPGEWGMAASLHSHKLLSQERYELKIT